MATDSVVDRSFTLVLDPYLGVLANIPLSNPDNHNQQLLKILSELPSLDDYVDNKLNYRGYFLHQT